ncbi:MAG TPA: EVE domain-containing protein [Cytophagaceae bacterium]|jgi:predicted RNA-binding protein with PUA-like domain
MDKNYWLVKSEPVKYAFDQLIADKSTSWDGVRNFQARNNMRAMKKGEQVLFYHSNEGKEVVGIAKVLKESYQDPTTTDPNWVVVDLGPVKRLKKAISLAQIKSDPDLANIGLIRQGRLSVISLKKDEFDRILKLSEE